MRLHRRNLLDCALLAAGLSVTSAGLLLYVPYLVAGGAVVLFVCLLRASRWMVRHKRRQAPAVLCTRENAVTPPVNRGVVAGEQTAVLVEELLAQGRYALLLRPQIAQGLSAEQLARAQALRAERMAYVPGGVVTVGPSLPVNDRDEQEVERSGRDVVIEPVYLDRYPVTNGDYQAFVDAGGYEQMSLWEPEVWPAVLEFADLTGRPGPRFWEHGRFREGEGEHPVVGLSWFEASAFARWSGKRLASDPEWIKAGAWPVPLGDGHATQRRFPWGDSLDRKCANLWGSGPGGVVSVREFAAGASVGGVYQLVGNVWEWTTSQFGLWDAATQQLETDVALKSIRGGAFNTYFENQAACQFQSGENPLARRDNIGFRCAISVTDLVPEFDETTLPDDENRDDDSVDLAVNEPVLVGAGEESQ